MENSELIKKALNYIRSETNKSDITIDDIAGHAGFSTDYFNRIFFAHTGFNIMEYVRFCRLKKAARLLRVSDTDILSIALECGYEAHESFSRAFKNKYGTSPSEYRKKYKKAEAYYGDFYNDTLGARLLHEFKDYQIADCDEVIDYLLETDALRYGYTAVCFHVNGGVALYNGEDFRDGFVWFTEWDTRLEGEIICDNWSKIAEYKKTFSDDRFDLIVYTSASDDFIESELLKYGVTIRSIERRPINIYTEAPYPISAPEGFSMRLLTYDDGNLLSDFYSENNSQRLNYWIHELYQRDVLGNDEHSVFLFGIFKDRRMVGISAGGLQRTHGFVVNNCVDTTFVAGYESEALYQYAFKFVTNAALEKGALPIDDVQTPYASDENKSGKFDSTELGYSTITAACLLK